MDAAQILAHATLFEDLSPEDVADLAEHLKRRTLAAGEVLFEKGDHGDSMFMVVDGIVDIYLPSAGDAVLLKQVNVGQYFGELTLFDEKPRSATARARTECELLELERDTLYEHMTKRPRIAVSMLAELSERIRETNSLLSRRAARDVNEEIDQRLTLGDRVADRVAAGAGSWTFIIGFFAVLVGWVVFNSAVVTRWLLHRDEPFDPFPFIFFNLILSIVAAFQGPVIMMSQNRQSVKDRAQAEIDFKVNLKNEIGIESLIACVAELRAHLMMLERGALNGKRLPSSSANAGNTPAPSAGSPGPTTGLRPAEPAALPNPEPASDGPGLV
jgi:uncharacterized membrane protein